LGSVGLSLSIIVLSGLVGYQDGAKIAGTRRAETLFEAINVQRTNIAQDLASENYVLALERCYYLATLIPNDPQANQCILNQISAATVTAPPIPPLPSNPPPSNATLAPTLTPSKPATTTPLPATRSPLEILLAQAQTEFAKSTVEGYDAARESLEAIRAVDPRFQQRTVEPLLCRSYEALGGYYEQNRRLSEMVLVMDKALKINCSLKRTDWGFTINAAQLYLSAKGYLDAGNLPQAVRVYRELMRIAPTFQNTKTLACEAFRLGGDTAAISQYGC
jgi:tetratricopeptide (TPR) repeat protein